MSRRTKSNGHLDSSQPTESDDPSAVGCVERSPWPQAQAVPRPRARAGGGGAQWLTQSDGASDGV